MGRQGQGKLVRPVVSWFLVHFLGPLGFWPHAGIHLMDHLTAGQTGDEPKPPNLAPYALLSSFPPRNGHRTDPSMDPQRAYNMNVYNLTAGEVRVTVPVPVSKHQLRVAVSPRLYSTLGLGGGRRREGPSLTARAGLKATEMGTLWSPSGLFLSF